MKQLKPLLKAQFISTLSAIARKKSLRLPILISIILGSSAIFLLIVRLAKFLFSFRLPEQFASIDIAPFIINGVILAMLIFLFLGSFSIMLSSLYLSSDTKLLLSMPIPEGVIFASKFVFTSLEECIYPIVLIYPFFIGFGIVHKLNPLFFIASLLFTISLPLIPFSIAALIIIPLANRISVKKLQTIALILNVIFGILIYIVSQIPNPAYHIVDIKRLPSLAEKMHGITQILPTNIAVSFSYAFKNSHAAKGMTEVLIFITIGVVLFYIALLFAKRNYKEGVFKAEQVENVKVSRHYSEKEIIRTKMLPKHISSLISKDIKILTRDAKIKTSIFTSIAYVVFFLFVFIVMPMSKQDKSLSDMSFMPILYFVIADFMLCGQNALILLFADRESIWIPLLSNVKSNEFVWSKFVLPFASGEIINIVLFTISFALIKGNNAKLLFITLPFAIFMPFLFTSSAIFVGMLFPTFRTPKNPRKLVSGKAAFVNGIIYVILTIAAVVSGIFSSFLVKSKGIAFTTIAMFLLVGVLTIAISFPLITFAINKYKNIKIES